MKSVHWIVAGAFVLALGCAGPAFANDAKDKDQHHGMGKWHHGKMGCHMSDANRKLIHEAMEKAHKKNEALHKEMREEHEALRKILAAKNFDEKAFINATDDMANTHAKMAHNMAEAFAEVAGKIPPEERAKCPMLMMGGGMHPGMMGHHGWGPGGPWKHHGMMGGEGMERHEGGGEIQPSTRAQFNE